MTVFRGMEISFQRLFQIEVRKFLFVVGIVAITHLLCQSLILPYGTALKSLMAENEVPFREGNRFPVRPSQQFGNSIPMNASDFTNTTLFVELVKVANSSNGGEEIGIEFRPKGMDSRQSDFAPEVRNMDNAFQLVENRNGVNGMQSEKIEDVDEKQDNSFILERASDARHSLSLEQTVKPNHEISADNHLEEDVSRVSSELESRDSAFQSSLLGSSPPSYNITYLKNSTSDASSAVNSAVLRSDLTTSISNSTTTSTLRRKKMRSELPPKSVTSIDDMNHILVRHRASSRSVRPRWSSIRDKEILAAKSQIANAPIVKNDQELYAPLFRNVSMFKRSYELMERMLKIYIYKEGEKPIFHQPILKGLYASEGWFMKLMEGNKRYVVKDPRKAHLFYMPFSSRMLEYSLYVRNSHNRTNLRQHLKEYTEKISAKYPFFNRTSGADHFLVACHDWAPYETRHHMERCIKALCNADVTSGFKIGRDVSLPETLVRSARNPLRDLGGKPPSERHILAFFAGNMHGYLRPILIKYWKDKDPAMKIFGPMPPGVASKMNYIHHMKSSKYCICPRGYEVNSPRVVEAIFYECVPVIISDNFVPPFFEVLDWAAFSVTIAEKNIPDLKEILMSIPKEKYLEMQVGVRKAQKHFLWHAKPVKYDLFQMTLHSIWYNRVFQLKVR